LILYGDASALVKRYLAEPGSEHIAAWVAAADRVACCRIGFVEVSRAIALSSPDAAALQREFERDWADCAVIEVDDALSRDAANLARAYALRSLDALHLAAARQIHEPNVHLATWDRRLWRAARAAGLDVLPESEP
jgi:predicted nucleic acid-binding protein